MHSLACIWRVACGTGRAAQVVVGVVFWLWTEISFWGWIALCVYVTATLFLW